MLKLKNASRAGGNGCNHIDLVMVLDGVQVSTQVEFAVLRKQFEKYPGGYKGLLIALLAAYWEERGTAIINLYRKVRIET